MEEAGFATMEVGDCFCMVGGLYHAGGHNSTKDQKRPMHDLSFCRGYLRQEVRSNSWCRHNILIMTIGECIFG